MRLLHICRNLSNKINTMDEFRKHSEPYIAAITEKKKKEKGQCMFDRGVFQADNRDPHFCEPLGIAIGSLYVRKYFNEDSKQIALEMVNEMGRTFGNTFRQVDWMDEKRRSSALIAYPDQLIDSN